MIPLGMTAAAVKTDAMVEPNPELRAKYKRVTIGRPAFDQPLEDSFYISHPIRLMKAMQDHPQIWNCIQELSFCPNVGNGPIEPTDGIEEELAIISLAHVAAGCQEEPRLWDISELEFYGEAKTARIRDWRAAVQTRAPSALLSAMLFGFVKLTRLILVDVGPSGAESFGLMILCDIERFRLPALKHVHVSTSSPLRPTDPGPMAYLMRLPCKTLTATKLEPLDEDHLLSTDDTRHTVHNSSQGHGVKNIEIRDSRLTPAEIAEIVKATTHMESLINEWSNEDFEVVDIQSFNETGFAQ